MKKNAYEAEFNKLSGGYNKSKTGERSYKSETSVRCHASMFTTKSSDCFTCTYCVDCVRCVHCTHCKGCENVSNSTYCLDSQNLSGCSYVAKSIDCHDCVFCVGCVGLVGKEFHILNVAYSRDAYFKQLAVLEKSLSTKLK